MILQALCALAEREELLGDPDFEPKPVAYLVRVADGGRLLGIEGTHIEPEETPGKSTKKPRRIAQTYKVPREPGRTSGDRANFLVDKAEYAFGLDPETDAAKRRPPEKLAKRLALFRDRVTSCLDATGDPGVRAVSEFLTALTTGGIEVDLPAETVGNDLFAFVYASDPFPVVHRPQVRAYWQGLRGSTAAASASFCLVSGELAPPAPKHTILKNIPGAVTSGVPLVSFNSKAFESYGWSGNDNAVISSTTAETYATALQRLLHPRPPDPQRPGTTLPRQNLRLTADTVLCYWSTGESALAAYLGDLMELNEVPELYESIWHGRVPALLEEGDPEAFYGLTLSGAQGRVIVRDWFETTVSDVVRHLAQYFSSIEIAFNTPKPKKGELPPRIPLRTLLESLGVRGKSELIPSHLATQIVTAALHGGSLPISAMQRAIQRARAEIGAAEWSDLRRRDARAALIKAFLIRKHRELEPTMNPNITTPGYLLGRMMAVIERLQQLALGDVNASVVDRYFSAASATPKAVFVRLLKNARHHARKARDNDKTVGFAIALDRQLDELAAKFDPKNNGFPAHLDLEQQGLFILGYHQQRHAFFTKKKTEETAQS